MKKASPAVRKKKRAAYKTAVKKSKPGTGKRSKALDESLKAEGLSKKSRGAIIGSIGRKKYGAKKMGEWSAKGRKKSVKSK